MIHITERQVREVLSMSKAIELVEESFRRLDDGRAENHPRRRVAMRNGTLLHYMAGGDNPDAVVGTKVYATNRKVGARFVVLLFDAAAIELLAVIDANALGQIRTGAAGGAAARRLAAENASRLALFGSGFQAETQLEAVAAVRALTDVAVYSRSAEKRESFAARMSVRLGMEIRAVASGEEALDGADIVTTVTNAREPVFPGGLLAPGMHINAAGSNHAKRRELDSATVSRCDVVAADSIEQARMEAGDLVQAAAEGHFDWNRAVELSAIIAGGKPGRTSPEQITLFESQGLAIQDIAAANYVYRQLT